jgi:phage tail-like protein
MIQNVGRRTVMKAVGAVGAVSLLAESGRAEAEDVTTAGTVKQQSSGGTGNFAVEFDGTEVTGWTTVSLPAVSMTQEDYREGTDSQNQRKVLGQPTYDDLLLERGFEPDDSRLWDWIDDVRQGKLQSSQRKVTVILNDTDGNAQTRWEFTKCWPTNYEPPDLDASAGDGVATERLSVTFDTMTRSG